MNTYTTKTILILGLILHSLSVNAQNDKRSLKKSYQMVEKSFEKGKATTFVSKIKIEESKKKTEALQYAKQNNIPVKFIHPKTGKVNQLIEVDENGGLYYLTSYNDDAAISTRTNYLHTNGGLGLDLNGDGMLIHIWDSDKAVNVNHIEFDDAGGNNRVVAMDGTAEGFDDHAQHVTGTILASGVNSNAKGMAWQANANTYDWHTDIEEVADETLNGMILSNHSYGYNTEFISDAIFGQYNPRARNWDAIAYNAPYYLTVVAAGNDGNNNSYNAQPLDGISNRDKLAGSAVGKNVLAVANGQDAVINADGSLNSASISSTSSQGPTDDYRVKPDITGNGTGLYSTWVGPSNQDINDDYNSSSGTSMASPNVSGSLLLLQEHYDNLNGSFMKAATLKGLALHTASDAGTTGPDPVFGWGLLNAKFAANTITKASTNTEAFISELTLNQGETISIPIQSNNINALQVSICWTDPEGNIITGANNNTPALVNDLDLRVDKNGATIYTPWKLTGVNTNGTGDNTVDPFERVDVTGASGVYVVKINHKGILQSGSQDFSLIITGANTLENNFVTTWQIDNPNTTITIPTSGSGYNYTAKWGDGTASTNVTGNATHTYSNPGTYNVAISGAFPRIHFNNTATDKDKIVEVKHWGDIQWQAMDNAFYGCSNLKITAGSPPNLQQVTSLNNTFNGISELESSITSWDVSTITSMNGTFKDINSFNQNIGSWDVSNVTDMTDMFSGVIIPTLIYDDILLGWNSLGSLQNNVVFDAGNSQYCTAVQEHNNIETTYSWTINDLGTVCNTTDFITRWRTVSSNESIVIPTFSTETYNFNVNWGDGTSSTNQTGNATHTYSQPGEYLVSINGVFPRIHFKDSGQEDKILAVEQWGNNEWSNMREAFHNCSNLIISTSDNPDLSELNNTSYMFFGASSLVDGVENWNVSTIDNMDNMFQGAISFNADIGNWNVGDVDRARNMFQGAISFNAAIGNWNVSTLDEMTNMFNGATSFNQDIGGWDVGQADFMEGMFYGATSFNQDISSWNTENVKNMSYMFTQAESFNQDIGGWDISSVTKLNFMFNGALNFDQNLGSWDISSVTTMSSMFFNSGLSVDNYDNTLIGWVTLDTAGGEISIPSNLVFSAGNSKYCLGQESRELLINSYGWTILDAGLECIGSTKAFVTTWKTDNIASSPTTQINIPVDASLTYNYSVNWGDGTIDNNITGDAQHDYASVGTYTVAITGDFPRIYFNGVGDKNKLVSIENWSNNPWTSMEAAFSGCNQLSINAQDTPNLSGVTSLNKMFLNAASITNGFSNWDVSTITDMTSLFRSADDFNDDLSSWDMSNVTATKSMFRGTSFNYDISNWDVSNVTDMAAMFQNATNFNQDITNWDVSLVTNMNNLFNNAQNFNQNLESWNISNVGTMTNMFNDSGLSMDNYDATLIGWSTLPMLQNDVGLGAVNKSYCSSYSQRQNIIDTYNWSITDAGRACPVILSPKVYLQGASIEPIVGEESLMQDNLRTLNLIPSTSLYSDGLKINPSVVFNVTGNDAIVDWIWVELRDETDNTIIVEGQSALLQRDGDIVSTDGITEIGFNQTADNYYVVIKHRNHLGVMTAIADSFSATNKSIDFTDANNQITYGANAQTTSNLPSGIVGMWAGNVNSDTVLRYQGSDNDTNALKDAILADLGNGSNSNLYSYSAYNNADVNMDGVIRYQGSDNDSNIIKDIILSHLNNQSAQSNLFLVIEQLPEN